MFESEQGHQFVVGGPGIAAPLTALIKPPLMYPSPMIEELVQAGGIATHPVIVLITTKKLGIQQSSVRLVVGSLTSLQNEERVGPAKFLWCFSSHMPRS